jgi:hypothetical protein
MRMRDVGLSFAGGCLVYMAMAACSSGAGTTSTATSGKGTASSGGSGAPGTTSGAPGATATSGAPGTSSGSPGTGGTAAGMGGAGGMSSMMHPVPPAMADPTDGSRLKAEYRIADDGSKESISGVWFDSMRNETCSFGTAADGTDRCLPTGAVAAALSYSDTNCTMQVVSVVSGCAQPPYIAVPVAVSATSCSEAGGGTHIYSVGAATTPAALYVSAGGMCFPLGQVPMASYFTLGNEVAPTSFVGSTMQSQ